MAYDNLQVVYFRKERANQRLDLLNTLTRVVDQLQRKAAELKPIGANATQEPNRPDPA